MKTVQFKALFERTLSIYVTTFIKHQSNASSVEVNFRFCRISFFFCIPKRWKKHICMSNLSNIFKRNTDYLMCMQSIRIIYNAFIVISLPHSRLLNFFRSNRLCQSLWHTCIHFHMYKIKNKRNIYALRYVKRKSGEAKPTAAAAHTFTHAVKIQLYLLLLSTECKNVIE